MTFRLTVLYGVRSTVRSVPRCLGHPFLRAQRVAEELGEVEASLCAFGDPRLGLEVDVQGLLAGGDQLQDACARGSTSNLIVSRRLARSGAWSIKRISGAVDSDDDQLAPLRLSVREPLEQVGDLAARVVVQDVKVVDDPRSRSSRWSSSISM